MGCWTEYCLICGGPGENFYYTDEDKEDNLELNINEKDTEWLDDVQVICYDYITKKGKYDSYGNVDIEGDDNMYCVCPSNWQDFDFIPGLLVHTVCLNLMDNVIKNFNNQIFFRIFKNKIGDNQVLKNVDYQGIEKNLGQAYELNKNEEYFLQNPCNIEEIPTKQNIEKKHI